MKAVVTGMNGTVAPFAGRELAVHGFEVAAWDRTEHPVEDQAAGRGFLDRAAPDWLFHIGMGPPEWAGFLAAESRARGIDFLYTSTVSVYADRETGPITPDTEPDATGEYARYKLACEARVREANPGAVIARIAWQIGSGPGSNNMIDYLHKRAAEDGQIRASTLWFPACSFLEDTAVVLHRLRLDHAPGTYLVDGNERMNFFEIASALNQLHGSRWTVRPVDDFALDLRMVDDRIRVPPIEARLRLDG
jgi:dTDP-4-dehydrorhamnose reductase